MAESGVGRLARRGLEGQNPRGQWVEEFGAEYAVPSEIYSNFEDLSWHNDIMPRFRNSEGTRVIWVGHPDPYERPGHHDGPTSRFTVSIASYDENYEREELGTDVYDGDDLQAALHYARGGV